MATNIIEKLNQISLLVNEEIEKLLPKQVNSNQYRLMEAMRYSSLSSGKKVRPFLVISAAEIFGISQNKAIRVATAIEFIHVYSLIHDDLPAMDDDDYRRGQLSCHKKFDEATAILAGDSLLTYAFQILSDAKTSNDAGIRADLINIISKAIGFDGMAGGQMFDLEANGKDLTIDEILELHRLKTGELFKASVEVGAVLGEASKQEKQALINFAHDFGLAFQVKDDILDFLEAESMGKKCDETNIVNAIGIEASKQKLNELHHRALSHLDCFEKKAELLRELTDFVVTRDK